MVELERLGVFGGSFDPIHIGHLIMAEIFKHALRLDQVLFLPAGRPPHKPTRQLADDSSRVAMIELALAGAPGFSLSRIDLLRRGYSYTAESLRRVTSVYPGVQTLYFLMGQDSLRDFPTWHNPGEVVRQARLGVALRPNVQVDLAAIERLVPEAVDRVDILQVPLIEISSSDIRRRVAAGLPYTFQVLPIVAQYIQTHGLYANDDALTSDHVATA